MKIQRIWLPIVALGLTISCAKTPPPATSLTVAAAANLTDVFAEIAPAFKSKTGIALVFSYGATAQLTEQIGNGAPFDVFAAADTQHVDSLVAAGRLTKESRAVYAIGQLALWIPAGEKSGIKEMKDLASKQTRFVAIAQPELAPYGAATVDALKAANLWTAVQPKLVFGNSINMAKQLASSGNADAAFTAYSLVLHESGTVLKVDPALYHPIEQGMATLTASPHQEAAKQFRTFLLGEEGRAILAKSGYLTPAAP